jgi:hypothetical protein
VVQMCTPPCSTDLPIRHATDLAYSTSTLVTWFPNNCMQLNYPPHLMPNSDVLGMWYRSLCVPEVVAGELASLLPMHGRELGGIQQRHRGVPQLCWCHLSGRDPDAWRTRIYTMAVDWWRLAQCSW